MYMLWDKVFHRQKPPILDFRSVYAFYLNYPSRNKETGSTHSLGLVHKSFYYS